MTEENTYQPLCDSSEVEECDGDDGAGEGQGQQGVVGQLDTIISSQSSPFLP